MNEQIPEWLKQEAERKYPYISYDAIDYIYDKDINLIREAYIAGVLSRSGGVWAKELVDIRNKLYDALPAGEINSFDLIRIIKWHINDIDNFCSRYASPAADKNNRGDELFNILNEVRGDKISVRTAYKKITGEKYKTKKYG